MTSRTAQPTPVIEQGSSEDEPRCPHCGDVEPDDIWCCDERMDECMAAAIARQYDELDD